MAPKYSKILGMFSGYKGVDRTKLKQPREDRALSARDLTDEAGILTDTIAALEKSRRRVTCDALKHHRAEELEEWVWESSPGFPRRSRAASRWPRCQDRARG
jgi:hypothetical protein